MKKILGVLILTLFPLFPYAQLTNDQKEKINEAVPAQSHYQPKEPHRVLIWNTPFMEESPHKGYTIPQSEYAFKMLGEKTGAYEPVVSDDQTTLLPENLHTFDAIVINNANGPWIRPTTEALQNMKKYGNTQDELEKVLQKSLLGFLEKGGGIFAFHHAIGGNTHWDQYGKLIGAGYWGHPWNEEVGVKLDEPGHPLLRVFQGKSFRIADEIFQFREPYSRENVRVLLSLDTENTNMTVPWIHRKDGDFALAWVHTYGQGRIFYSAIGHRTEIWWNPLMLEFYLDAMQFVLGDIDAPTKPIPVQK